MHVVTGGCVSLDPVSPQSTILSYSSPRGLTSRRTLVNSSLVDTFTHSNSSHSLVVLCCCLFYSRNCIVPLANVPFQPSVNRTIYTFENPRSERTTIDIAKGKRNQNADVEQDCRCGEHRHGCNRAMVYIDHLGHSSVHEHQLRA